MPTEILNKRKLSVMVDNPAAVANHASFASPLVAAHLLVAVQVRVLSRH